MVVLRFVHMSAIPIDTLQFAFKLKEGGFTDAQAETIVKTLNDAQVTTVPAVEDQLKTLEDRLTSKIVTRVVLWTFAAISAQTAVILSILALLR